MEKGKGGGKERGREGERKRGGGGEGKGRKINGVDAYWKVIPRSTLNRNRRIVVVDETLISV